MREYTRNVIVPRELRLAEHVYSMRLDRLDLTYADSCNFDFTGCQFGEPLPILLLAEKIKALVKKYPNCKYRLIPAKSQFCSFADHIGFFRYVGWPRGREPGEAWGSENYIPIEKFDLAEYRKRAGTGPVAKLINEEASRLTSVLSRQEDGATFDILQYAIREILRNAAEHSSGTRVSIMAQYWPTKDIAEIVVIDDGVGIPTNLYENEYVECANAREALKFSLMPGVSGVALEERIAQDPYWGNSGFGLYVTSRICSENGQFRIISEQQGLTLARGNQIEHGWSHEGTCVQMRLETKRSGEISARIPQIIEDGEEQRKELMSNYPIQASAASKMLESQYRKRVAASQVMNRNPRRRF